MDRLTKGNLVEHNCFMSLRAIFLDAHRLYIKGEKCYIAVRVLCEAIKDVFPLNDAWFITKLSIEVGCSLLYNYHLHNDFVGNTRL